MVLIKRYENWAETFGEICGYLMQKVRVPDLPFNQSRTNNIQNDKRESSRTGSGRSSTTAFGPVYRAFRIQV